MNAYGYDYDFAYSDEIDLESYLVNLVKTSRKKSYFFVCTVNGDGTGWTQKSFHKSELNEALQYIQNNKNKRIFVPTVLFDSRNRLDENIGQIRKIIIDLDIYKSVKHKDKEAEAVMQEITEKFFDTKKIPMSNAITFSGGGIYLEWEFQYTPGGNVLQKRRVVAKILYELLKEYGPDAKSLDAAHVFGLTGTVNWKYGSEAVVRTYKNSLQPYTLSGLARSLPSLWDIWQKEAKIETKKERKPTKKQMASITPIHKERTLAHDHIITMKQLVQVRNGEMDGYREMALFFVRNAYHKMHTKRFTEGDSTLFLESYQIACEINNMLTNPLKDEEIRKNTLNTKKLYRFKTETIYDWFDITLDEQIQLKVKTKTAIREKDKRRKRVDNGIKEENTHDYKRKVIEEYFRENPSASNVQAEKDLGISRPTIIKYRSKK